MGVYGAIVTSTGRVGVHFGRIPLEGFLTLDGAYVAGADTSSGIAIRVVATRTDFPLSNPSGVYGVTMPTQYKRWFLHCPRSYELAWQHGRYRCRRFIAF